jgi:cytidine deaminase
MRMSLLCTLLVSTLVSATSLTYGASMITSDQKQTLIQSALEAQKGAYCPYSNYPVGAALLTEDGTIYKGCNVENASYGLTNCAERTAAFKAVSEGYRSFIAIAVATRDGGTPCGACRQILNEFGPHMQVFSVSSSGEIKAETTLDILLPNAFGPHNLE